METKHTPIPWRIDDMGNGTYGLSYSDGEIRSQVAVFRPEWLCEEHGGTTLENASFVIEACNSYEQTRRDLETALEALKRCISALAVRGASNCEAVKEARAAINQIEKGE